MFFLGGKKEVYVCSCQNLRLKRMEKVPRSSNLLQNGWEKNHGLWTLRLWHPCSVPLRLARALPGFRKRTSRKGCKDLTVLKGCPKRKVWTHISIYYILSPQLPILQGMDIYTSYSICFFVVIELFEKLADFNSCPTGFGSMIQLHWGGQECPNKAFVEMELAECMHICNGGKKNSNPMCWRLGLRKVILSTAVVYYLEMMVLEVCWHIQTPKKTRRNSTKVYKRACDLYFLAVYRWCVYLYIHMLHLLYHMHLRFVNGSNKIKRIPPWWVIADHVNGENPVVGTCFKKHPLQ